MSKFKENDRVVVVTEGKYQGGIGTVEQVRGERCLVKIDRCVLFDNTVIIDESALRMAELADEYMDDDFELKLEGIRNHLRESDIILEADANLLDYAYYQEMAGRIPGQLKVGKKRGILIVAMGANESRGEAHFHVYRSEKDLKAWKNGACLMFKENKYFDHADNKETLTRDEMKTLMECLKSRPSDTLPGKSYWQYLIYLWNGNNSDFEIDIDTPMPDYDYDTITRYKAQKENK